jgi:catechol 2,3-dioxygenase-like lactoylglutathione lyase family enzyme
MLHAARGCLVAVSSEAQCEIQSLGGQTVFGAHMKTKVFCICIVVAAAAFAKTGTEKRPKITGIDHVDFYSTDTNVASDLYMKVLGLATASPIEPNQTRRYVVGKQQWVGYSPAPDANVNNRMDHVAFVTDNCGALRNYLAGKGVKVPDSVEQMKDGSHSFSLEDPEGHRVEFVEHPKKPATLALATSTGKPDPVSQHMIHAGFVVHDRNAEDNFYKEILGFHLYWFGGMQPDRTDWVAMQVPDGTDWLEYMLNIKPDADLRLTGVMNHISLGVRDMKQAQAKLESHDWKPHGEEHSQMGRDGKWQLNVYDPDHTRVELMEFTPAQKPCCSEFQGQHPHEP